MLEYSAGTAKGETEAGYVFNSPFKLGNNDGSYTSEAVVDTFATNQATLTWTPCTQHVFQIAEGGTVTTAIDADVKITRGSTVYYGTFASASAAETGTLAGMTFVDATGTTQSVTLTAGDKISFKYDNVIIPQNDLPTLRAKMKSIALLAKARRIAVYYSQMAAFQAKTDYGFDLGDNLAEQAAGQLAYEIDTEVINLLAETAGAAQSDLTWSKTLPVNTLAA